MKLTVDTYRMWDDLSDKQRIDLIEELILTAPNAQSFKEKILKVVEKLELD